MYRIMVRLARGAWHAAQAIATVVILVVALQFSPLVRKAEAQYLQITNGSTLGNGTNGLFQTFVFIFGGGAQLGVLGYPISGIYSVQFPITATAVTSATDAVVTATVPGLVTGTFSGAGVFLTPTAPTIACAMVSYTTATAGPGAGIAWTADLLTGTSAVTGSGAAPLLVRVRFTHPGSATLTPGQMRCDVIAH
jgi:hypothetical protein